MDQYAVPPGDHAVLLEAIGRATGLDHPFREHPGGGEDGPAVRVLGGVIDRERDRVAWVERHRFQDAGWVSVWLNLSGEGTSDLPRITGWVHQEPKPRVSVSLTPDRDDKVTGVDFLRFFGYPGESLMVVYNWSGGRKHLLRLTLRAPGLDGVQAHWVRLGGRAATLAEDDPSGDATLWYLRESYLDDDELMYGLRLPDLTPLIPIPVPRRDADAEYPLPTLAAGPPGTMRWTERLSDGDAEWRDGRNAVLRLPRPDQGGFADDPSLVWDRLRAVLGAGAPPDGPDILIGALAVPFWDATGPAAPGVTRGISELSRGPWWFPAGWYHYLRTPVSDGGAGRPRQAAAWLAWLDRLGGQDDGGEDQTGWDPSWTREEGIARFALTHLRRQAGVLASACRAGKVPVLGDFGTWRTPPVLSAAPPGFARAWRELPKRFRGGRFTEP
ncbi:hypothetical protein [Actinophytocola sp. NPDC049390]|uniref:hypothetical protein n=1 Tax=Actinophytocola sp. NPDC049390 TaxID=3363894 RepID=UPI0037B9C5CE